MEILRKYDHIFNGIGKCNDVKITLHLKADAKPIVQPARSIPFHLRKKFDTSVNEMISEDVFEEHHGPTQWLSNPVIVLPNP